MTDFIFLVSKITVDGDYSTELKDTCSLEPMRNLNAGQKQQLEMDMEQQTGSKSGKEYIRSVYCHPAYLTFMQSVSEEMPGWMNHKLESRLPGEIPTTSGMQMIPL